MRIRYKKWARPELAACPYYYQDGTSNKGCWREKFIKKSAPLYAELGCGKGAFIAEAAFIHQNINFIACDIKSEMLAYTRRKAVKRFEEEGLQPANLVLLTLNIEKTETVFGEGELDRIYINFCPPWKRESDYKHRLTHPRQLLQYIKILKPGGEIHFKTDDDTLFEDSLVYFEECGFMILRIERDLHRSSYTENIITEHEKMFSEEGKKIKFGIFVNT
ncbi:MAG: tRNA (guanosine(46)-N7)-methyltransferase TrmB [Ruminococcus sp.]|jgi:tRNA (guanine-N7-)-methyltransferase|nr:tRNA (guanosine(46)-N7)-methyltransferase TrmB [Ruminococcus sp.]